ncbi:hypothetical protein BN2156_03403 [Mycolicibacterium neworleansense]|uniref:Cullin, a subunit of E3 ubiquitin ligase n=1 Tax=Mycolicibacterium neworleansense TaxID=146018 RepID=A0A0H5RRF1_9MYCO|nr:hypothetical protein BN2156_03403 [Mycolicibacterium neworleansense]
MAAGTVNRHQLRTRFTALYPNVYIPADVTPTLTQRTTGAWLWSQRNGVVAGLAAAALHGSKWIDRTTAIELIHTNPRAPDGVITRRDMLLDGETASRRGVMVTTCERTAFDIGRRSPLSTAVARLDALFNATGCAIADVQALAGRHPGAPGLRRLETTLTYVDSGSQSPRESWLRLLLVRDGLPVPATQIPVAVEYDGIQHRTDRWQYVTDIRRLDMLKDLGWIVIRVVAEDGSAAILRRVRAALAQRQSSVHQRRHIS